MPAPPPSWAAGKLPDSVGTLQRHIKLLSVGDYEGVVEADFHNTALPRLRVIGGGTVLPG